MPHWKQFKVARRPPLKRTTLFDYLLMYVFAFAVGAIGGGIYAFQFAGEVYKNPAHDDLAITEQVAREGSMLWLVTGILAACGYLTYSLLLEFYDNHVRRKAKKRRDNIRLLKQEWEQRNTKE